ncbi:putative Ig domain-containing protein [Thiogranum longum]|uniref:Putative Ig domain-containing protein n=1 Tax=Thiogranum longum TaxID=1537524 RepID=A0A4R1HFX5_9GAMM|nr:putative Ig domain-containing protein [Thiogranum longum]TCK18199.1 putative Ig domain-containing protein [Thiogranum longum]
MLQRIIPVTLKALLAIILASQLFACGGGSVNEDISQVVPEAVISGSVGDGPIVGATLNIYDNSGKLIQTETSDNSARYSARIKAKGNAYPLTIEVTDGIDLVTGRAPDFKLVSVVAYPSEKWVNINPYTTLIVEAARSMSGGLNEQNITTVKAAVVDQLNFGLDPSLVADPFRTEITDNNIANIIKASEALGEMIRRARDNLMATGTVNNADDVVMAIADDMSDGTLDGLGGNRASSRITAVAIITSAQVLIESLTNSLRVDGASATDKLDASILTTRPTSVNMTSDVTLNPGMLQQTRATIAAARILAPGIELTTVADMLDLVQAGSLPSDVDQILPVNSRQYLDQAIALTTSATDEQLVSVNDAMGSDPAGSSDGTTGSPPAINAVPVISGTATSSIDAGAFYRFQPSASDPEGGILTFSIVNRPVWASFNTSTGRLTGTPGSTDAGRYNDIIISVTDGTAAASLPAFSISVNSVTPTLGSVSLNWAAPVSREDGNALAVGEIAGYTLYYGTAPGDYPNSVDISDASTTSATVTGLPLGTYYFVLTTTDISGLESGYSSVATRTIQ